jgi:hypothetical protein
MTVAEHDKALDFAWDYFSLHASQRMTVFNYFVAFAGLILTGMATAIQASPRLAMVGVALGLLLVALSFIFWKLDQRTAFLIDHAKAAIVELEPPAAPLIASEEYKTPIAERETGLWTYGKAFRVIFATMALVGLIGAALGALRATGALTWGDGAGPPPAKSSLR